VLVTAALTSTSVDKRVTTGLISFAFFMLTDSHLTTPFSLGEFVLLYDVQDLGFSRGEFIVS